MENYNQNTFIQPKSFSKKKVIIIIINILIATAIVVVTVFFLNRLSLINEVKSTLNSVNDAMNESMGTSDNGFPVKLPDSVKVNGRVLLSGGGTFDGTVYCVTGSSLKDASIIYKIDSSLQKPSEGACPELTTVLKPTDVPAPVLGVISGTKIGITWITTSDATSYSVQCATDTEFTQNITKATSAAKENTCKNLKASTTYYIRVRANNSAGAGPWSSSLQIATISISVAPVNLEINPISSTGVSYSWSPISNATSYIIEWSTDTSYLNRVETKEVNTMSGNIVNLKPDTVYYFHVKAVTLEFDKIHSTFSNTVGTLMPHQTAN